MIEPALPPLFADLQANGFTLLYRGSRDGLTAGSFHRLCDKHPNTLTLIATPEDYRFGGFTPCAWDAGPQWMVDERAEGFLFTLKNPHGLEPRKFPLKPERKHEVIYCGPDRIRFGGAPDLALWNTTYTGGFGATSANEVAVTLHDFLSAIKGHFTIIHFCGRIWSLHISIQKRSLHDVLLARWFA
jgi:hypothetical protein